MRNVLGVSIGTRHLKISIVSNHELRGFISEEIPENSVVDDAVVTWNALSEELKNIRKQNNLHTKNCALVLPDSGTYVRRLTMPVMNDRQLQVNLPYEFRDVLSEEPEKYLFDYSMIGVDKNSDGDPVDMQLTGATVSKNLISQYTQMFERAGLHLVKATPRVIALEDLINRLSEDNKKQDFALLDLGSMYTRIDIFHNGIYEVTRSIDHGIDDLVNAAADVLNCDAHIAREYLLQNKDSIQSNASLINAYDSIAVEVMRALNYYTYENRNNTLEKLYYCGSGAEIQPFLNEIGQNISLPLVSLSSFDEAHGQALLESPSAVGAALGD